MTTEDRKWKKYEKMVARVHQTLSPDAVVRHDETLRGKSGNALQFDVVIRDTAGCHSILLVIECRDTAKRVDRRQVEAFISKADDVGANKAVFVCNAGFTKDAVRTATQRNVGLCSVAEAETKDWSLNYCLPALCRILYVTKVSFDFSTGGAIGAGRGMPLPLPEKPEDWYLRDSGSGEKLNIDDLMAEAWHRSAILKPGEYTLALQIQPNRYVILESDYLAASFQAHIIVIERLFYRRLGLVDTTAIKYFRSGALNANSLTSEAIDTCKIESEWTELASPNEIPSAPILFVLRLAAEWRASNVGSAGSLFLPGGSAPLRRFLKVKAQKREP